MSISMHTRDVMSRIEHLESFFAHSSWAQHKDAPGACDFAVGNPHESEVP